MPARRTTPENCGHFPLLKWKNDPRLASAPARHQKAGQGSRQKLASVADLPEAPGLDDTQLAALTTAAIVLLNLTETISN